VPTGVASEAEYVELGLSRLAVPEDVRAALDAVLPDGIDVVEAVTAGPGGLTERIEASRWLVELPGVASDRLEDAVVKFTTADQVLVERLTKHGRRSLDARAPVVRCGVVRPDATAQPAQDDSYRTSDSSSRLCAPPSGVRGNPCAILDLVVRHVTPSVRPDEVLAGLRVVADLKPPLPVRATRLAQGMLTEHGDIVDPLAADREGHLSGRPSP